MLRAVGQSPCAGEFSYIHAPIRVPLGHLYGTAAAVDAASAVAVPADISCRFPQFILLPAGSLANAAAGPTAGVVRQLIPYLAAAGAGEESQLAATDGKRVQART